MAAACFVEVVEFVGEGRVDLISQMAQGRAVEKLAAAPGVGLFKKAPAVPQLRRVFVGWCQR